MLLSPVWLTLLKWMMYVSLGLLAAGMFVARQTFLHMTWAVGRPTGWRAYLTGVWVSKKRAQMVERQYAAASLNPRLLLVNRIARAATLTGFVSLILWICAMCSFIYALRVRY